MAVRAHLQNLLLAQERHSSHFVAQRRAESVLPNLQQILQSIRRAAGDRDLPEPLFPIAGKDKFSDLWRPCDASTSLARVGYRNLSSVFTLGREHMSGVLLLLAAGLVVLIVLLCRCRLDYFALHSAPCESG